MAPRLPTVRLPTLVVEELRALPRNPFALGALAGALVLLALAGAFATGGPGGFTALLLFTWLVAPLAVAIVVASRVASARRTRFVDSLYTTPLQPRTWLAAQLVVGAILALLVLAASAPFVLVYAWHLGAPPQAWSMLGAALGVSAFAVAFGAFCGVVVGDTGPGAAAGLAGGGAALSFLGLVVESLLSSAPPTPIRDALLRATHVSPLALAVDASGLDLFNAAVATRGPAAFGLAALAVGLLAAAWLAYTRHQGPLGWEPRPGRWLVALLALAALATPVAAASLDYHAQDYGARATRIDFGQGTAFGLVPRGASYTDETFTGFALVRMDPLLVGSDNARDLLVLLPGASASDVRVEIASPQVAIVAGAPVADGTAHATKGPGFPGDGVGNGDAGVVYRVPLTLRPTSANALSYAHETLFANVTWSDASGQAHVSRASLTLVAGVPGASEELLAAGAPFPLACASALVVRKIRTR